MKQFMRYRNYILTVIMWRMQWLSWVNWSLNMEWQIANTLHVMLFPTNTTTKPLGFVSYTWFSMRQRALMSFLCIPIRCLQTWRRTVKGSTHAKAPTSSVWPKSSFQYPLYGLLSILGVGHCLYSATLQLQFATCLSLSWTSTTPNTERLLQYLFLS